MKDKPFMIVTANSFTNEIKNDMREQHPSCIYQIGESDDDNKKYLLSVLEYDSEKQVFKDLDLTKSYLIEGDWTWSLF